MTLHQLTHRISQTLTPETDSFYDYVLWSSDDNGGFLRTCFRRKRKPLRDRDIQPLEEALVCFREPFAEDYGSNDCTYVKLQLFYQYDAERNVGHYIRWSRDMGFPVPYLFDLKAGTYRVLDASMPEEGGAAWTGRPQRIDLW